MQKNNRNREKSGNRTGTTTLRIAHLRHSIRKKQNIGKENFSSWIETIRQSHRLSRRQHLIKDSPCLMKSLR